MWFRSRGYICIRIPYELYGSMFRTSQICSISILESSYPVSPLDSQCCMEVVAWGACSRGIYWILPIFCSLPCVHCNRQYRHHKRFVFMTERQGILNWTLSLRSTPISMNICCPMKVTAFLNVYIRSLRLPKYAKWACA